MVKESEDSGTFFIVSAVTNAAADFQLKLFFKSDVQSWILDLLKNIFFLPALHIIRGQGVDWDS